MERQPFVPAFIWLTNLRAAHFLETIAMCRKHTPLLVVSTTVIFSSDTGQDHVC